MTFHSRLPALLVVIFILGYVSCRREIIPVTAPVNVAQTTASVQGYVVNENGSRVTGATVTCGTATTTTDAYGYFRFTNIQLSKDNGYVKVSYAGYFTGSRSFVTNTGRVNNVRIQLLPKTNVGNIDASTGGSVTFSGGVSITLPAGSVINASTNASYNGQIKVAARWIDPTVVTLAEQMPGDLRGIATSGSEMGLQTFGMLATELTGSGGELLQIAPGKKATINFKLPTSISSSAPATIALWYFDETAGTWKEEGTATKSGNNYVADVSHFSFWNCDAGFAVVNFSATIINSNGNPLMNARVRIRRTVNNAATYGFTDSSGYVSGKIPANEALVFEVLDQCYNVIYSQNIGPFVASINLGTITVIVSGTSLITISGTITNCNNAPVTNGYVVIQLGTRYFVVPVTNGNYTATVTNCSGNSAASITGIDNSTSMQGSVTITLNGQTVIVPSFQVCGNASAQTINYTLDGTTYNIIAPPDSVVNDIGQGNVNGNFVYGYDPVGYGLGLIDFTFNGTNLGVGSFPLNPNNISLDLFALYSIVSPSPVVNITQYGGVGQMISGNFNVQIKRPPDYLVRTLTCTFTVKRH